MLHASQIIFVSLHSLKVAMSFCLSLSLKTLSLVHRVDDFRIRVYKLPLVDEKLESIADLRIFVITASQRFLCQPDV